MEGTVPNLPPAAYLWPQASAERIANMMSRSSIEEQERRDLVRSAKWLYKLGFTPGTSGNLSIRLGPERLLVTPTGVSKCMLKPEDMVIADLQGRLLAGTRRVTSEISMHLAVYAIRSDVSAVIHSHPPVATAFACSGRALDQMLCQEPL